MKNGIRTLARCMVCVVTVAFVPQTSWGQAVEAEKGAAAAPAASKVNAAGKAPAQDEPADFSQLSLEELLEQPLKVASGNDETVRQAPAVVTMISRTDIDRYGARDLADILQLVPGFQFGLDVLNSVGLGLRGSWVHEGKVLIMLDGIQANDLAYGSDQQIGTFPADMIDHVEILRGPGSAIYGGFAEMGVINVITRTGAQLKGLHARGSAGVMGTSEFVRNGQVSVGTKADGFDISAHLGGGSAPLSTRPYVDFFGGSIEGGRQTTSRDWRHVLVSASYRDMLTIRYQRYSLAWRGQDGFTTVIPATASGLYAEKFLYQQENVQGKGVFKLGPQLQIEPTLEYLSGVPVSAAIYPSSSSAEFNSLNNVAQRYSGEIVARYNFFGDSNFMAGGGYQTDTIDSVTASGNPGLHGANGDVFFRRTRVVYGLTQLVLRLRMFDFTAGVRFENTSFGNAVAPRAAVLLNYERFNAKLLFSRSYRAPMPFQAFTTWWGTSGSLRPEHSTTFETELGYAITPDLRVKANGFVSVLNDTIQYLGSDNSFLNRGFWGSAGLETEAAWQTKNYGAFLNVAYHRPVGDVSTTWRAAGKPAFLAFAPIAASAGANYRVTQSEHVGHFEIGPSAVFLAPRFGQSMSSSQSTTGEVSYATYPAQLLCNLAVTWRQPFQAQNIDVRVNAHNIFNSNFVIIQPYLGTHAPIPALDRQLLLELDLNI